MSHDELIATQKKALDWWYEGFGSGDIAHAYDGFAEDATWSGTGKSLERVVYHGKAAIIPYQERWVHTVMGGKITYFPKHCVCDGNVLLAYWEDEATPSGAGETYRNHGVFVWEYDGGPLVKRAIGFWDNGPLGGYYQSTFAQQDVSTGT